ncbi:uncharacterized protein LOC117482507 isoform X2 [Trematomus bernacchii]|uniref:uncharacterized protein LOC117482507 isoform X2 n=1 Tax=Trematomus bernacchii TaxID=40690 RepID=UPI00146B5640|nr:uncharacterized protein LOC117482507 isoform X2 [Trematomus bernacchii]
MDELKRIKMSSLLILLLQFTGTAIGQRYLYLSVRVGDEANLPCNNVTNDQDECNSTTWLFTDSRSSVILVENGQIDNHAKSDRLRVTENCSLVVKKVTEEDAGQYTYRQYNKANQQQGSDSDVYLSVVTMTEHQDNDEVTLRCSVSRYGGCRHKVKWLLQGRDVDEDNNDIRTSASNCSASVTFLTSHFSYTPRSTFFTCAVTDAYNVQTFRPQSSDEDQQAATPTTTTTTITSGYNPNPDWWLYIVVALLLVALLTTIVAFITWRKMKGKEARKSDSVGQTSNPAVNSPETNPATADPEEGVSYASISYTKNTNKKAEGQTSNPAVNSPETNPATADPEEGVSYASISYTKNTNKKAEGQTSNPAVNSPETNPATADPEEGVSYASISYTKNTNKKAEVKIENDADEGDAVTYSTVKASTNDPNSLYDTIS